LNKGFLPDRIYILLFALLGFVYVCGLFVPLMDNDSAHHANIALRMYLTGDYVNLVDYGKDYLDKPHFHFWLSAFSYKIFGVTGFAYKLPSFLFTILGTYSVFRLGKLLYDHETGRLAALVIASAFGYILANNDVRMEAILTAAIAFSSWQLAAFVQEKRMIHIILAALGLALGFSTKGHIAVFVPAVSTLFYILYRKEWKLIFHWKWLLLILLFGLFISPVVYCYYLQYNLHPEKVVRGKNEIDGVKFILLNQSVERFSGEMGSDARNDYLFFLHSFLWAFAPWSILCYIAIVSRINYFLKRKEEWMTTGVFLITLLVVSLSGFKLPHYLNIVFPASAVIVSAFIFSKAGHPSWPRIVYRIQLVVSILLLSFVAVLTFWAFPVTRLWVIAGVVILLSLFFYLLRKKELNYLQKGVAVSVAAMALGFFLLNTNFYPQLLKYQGGNELAFATKNKVNPAEVYFWKDNYSSSYNFYTATLRKPFTDSTLAPGEKTWLLYDLRNEEEIRQSGLTIGTKYSSIDYEITKLDLKFVNPKTRESTSNQLVIGEVTRDH
jgi:4-amino-4-deoxy-L-arabinose transferase-like glycosyltransferase